MQQRYVNNIKYHKRPSFHCLLATTKTQGFCLQATNHPSLYIYTAFQNHHEEGFGVESLILLGRDMVSLGK